MKLHLLRHAKTNPISSTKNDFDRGLLSRGYEQIELLRSFLLQQPINPTYILCSSAIRTQQTLNQLIDLWPNAVVQIRDELYLASKLEILKEICKIEHDADILVIGHNEGLSELGFYLSNQASWLKTCGLLSLEFNFDNSAFISNGMANIIASFRVEK